MIDAHHHLWRYTSAEFGWIDDEMAVLRRDFLPRDLIEACCGITLRRSARLSDRLCLAARRPSFTGCEG
jgi:predicted TIM-barrel fold metal-dependent hydrolase